MELKSVDNSLHSPTSKVNHHLEDKTSHLLSHEEIAPKSDINFTCEEVRSIIEVIAATGKFWHDWDMLKIVLSSRLKQVLAEYPEAQVVRGDGPQPSSLSGETYPELVERLDEALLSFIEGPPFTLQRLCEILLTPKSTYKSLSKLALALEKNLLVTSTLTVCTDPYPTTLSPVPAEPDRVIEESLAHSAPVPNGVQTKAGDGDEEMVEAEADEDAPSVDTDIGAQVANTEPQDAQNVDTGIEEEEEVSEAPVSNPDPSSDSGPAVEPCTTSDVNSPTPAQP